MNADISETIKDREMGSMNVDISETIKDRELGFDSVALYAAQVCFENMPRPL